MQNIRSLSDSELLSQIRLNAESERRSGLLVIHQMREVARRRLDAELGYSSLHAYCMEELGYSPGSAWRRIKSMQALEALPELEKKIAQGSLTLANVSQVQAFCDKNEKSLEEKKELFAQVSGLSKRETERKLAEIAPLPERPEKVRPLDAQSTELRVTLSAETLAQLDQLRDWLAHSHPNAGYAEIIAYLAEKGVQKLDPANRGAKEPRVKQPLPVTAGAEALPPGDKTASVPAATRRFVWRRDGGRCTYVCPSTRRVCGATARLQFDHTQPRAQGGGHEPTNLRLRCQRHNLLAAVQVFGMQKMGRYLRT